MKIKFKIIEIAEDDYVFSFNNFRIEIDWEMRFVIILDDDKLDYQNSFGHVELNNLQYRRLLNTASNLISTKREFLKTCDEIFKNEN